MERAERTSCNFNEQDGVQQKEHHAHVRDQMLDQEYKSVVDPAKKEIVSTE